MNVLALDSAGSACVIVVGQRGQVVQSASFSTVGSLSARLINELDALLSRAQLKIEEIDLFGVGLGPGGFTSVRVGMATLKGVAFAHDKALVGVPSLQLLAQSWADQGEAYLVIREAYRGEVYAAVYQREDNSLSEQLAPVHGKPEEIASALRKYALIRGAVAGGSGYWKYRPLWQRVWDNPDSLVELPAERDQISAGALLRAVIRQYEVQGKTDFYALEPHYVRGADAVLPKNASQAGDAARS